MNIARPAAFSPNGVAASAAAPGAGPAGFVAELANDPLRCLTLTGREACDLFAQPNAFPYLSELRLTRCNDDALVALADILRHGARPAFELVLDRDAGVEIDAAGLRAIAPLSLSGIVLRGLPVPPAAALALSESRMPVLIALPFFDDGASDSHLICRIPTLTCLNAGNHALSAASVDALAKSTTLTSLVIGPVTRAEDIASLAHSRTVSELTLRVAEGAASGFPALAAMPALGHLTLQGSGTRGLTWKHGGMVADQDAALLAANPRLSSLSLGMDMVDEATARLLARAPGLQRLDLGHSSAAPVSSKRLVTNAWTAAGKTLANLTADVHDDEDDVGVLCWG